MNHQSNQSQEDRERKEEDMETSTGEDDSVEGSSSNSESDTTTDEDENDQVGPMQSERGEKDNEDMLNEADLEAGIQPRGQEAKVRTSSSMYPRSTSQRRRHNRRRRMFGNFFTNEEEDTDKTYHSTAGLRGHGRLMVRDIEEGRQRQYRLTAVRPPLRLETRIKNWLGLGRSVVVSDNKRRSRGGVDFNEMIMKYLRWTVRTSFIAVILSAALAFLSLTMTFAFLIWRIGDRHPKCIGGVDFETKYFTDAFALSWTTFRYAFSVSTPKFVNASVFLFRISHDFFFQY
jgi:hypothetical protein